jgi:predicted nuclease of restriction endonuclease-like (RecB) superfamily
MPLPTTPPEYREWLSSLKDEIHQARRRAALAVNSEMILLYWRIGREIVQRQAVHKWGARVIDQLATDLHSEFPDVRGFSPRNLKYMRKLALTWPDQQIVQQVVAQLPWGQNVTLLDKLQDDGQRLWYARAAIEHGWSRDILVHQIETRLHERQGRAITNFDATMEPVRAAAAADLFKDPYVLDFVDIAEDAHERHLERALTERIKDLLLELGKGFSFMGSQYHLDVAGQDYYLDLLFYHTRLHSYVVIDLKMGEFEPEFAGKMNFYLAAVDDKLRTEGDNPSIGLILCRGKNGLIVEYALRDLNKPMAVSEYTVLPPNIANALPSPDVLEAGLEDHLGIPDVGDGSDSVSGGPGRGK